MRTIRAKQTVEQVGVGVVGRQGSSVDARARNAEQRALPAADRQGARLAVNELTAVRDAHLLDLFAKKSRSTIS
jgi:hypothetical protein